MRELMLVRIQKIKEKNENFAKNTMRWGSRAVNNVHISEVKFSELTDEDLLSSFEMIVFTSYKQM